MNFIATPLEGAYVIEMEPIVDERGFLARTWCRAEFQRRGLDADLQQCNLSANRSKGTLRGMHYQEKPYEEAKLVQCISGGIYDVIIDLRPESYSYKRCFAVELMAENCKMLYVPRGFAHGFQTLEDDTYVSYLMFESYHPESAMGIRWNDPSFAIRWPIHNPTISQKDRDYPDFTS